MRLIFSWINFHGFLRIFIYPQNFVSTKFLKFFYPGKEMHVEFLEIKLKQKTKQKTKKKEIRLNFTFGLKSQMILKLFL